MRSCSSRNALHLFAERGDRRGIGLQLAIETLVIRGHPQQHGHPQVGEQHIDRDHHAEHVRLDLEHLFHGGLVGGATDPAAGNGGHAAPQLRVDAGGCDRFPEEQRDGAPNYHAQGPGEEQDEGLRTQPQRCRQIDGQRQEHQRGGQQVPRGDEVEPGLLAIDQPEACCRAPAGNSRAPAPGRSGRSVARTAAPNAWSRRLRPGSPPAVRE